MSKVLLEEVKALEAEKAEKEKQVKGEDEKVKETPSKDKGENRDWKRNGVYLSAYWRLCVHVVHFR
jgi:hypothetical protein